MHQFRAIRTHHSKKNEINEMLGNFYLGNKTSYINSDRISVPTFQSLNLFKNLRQFLENLNDFNDFFNLPMQPNLEVVGIPNPPTNKKIFYYKSEYNLWSKCVEYSDHQMGASHPMLSNKDAKFMKI